MNKEYTAILSYVKGLNPPKKNPCWVDISKVAEATSISKEHLTKLIDILTIYNLLRRKATLVSMPESWYGTGIQRRTRRSYLPQI